MCSSDLANPVARINLDDQVQASKIAGYFGKDEYRSTVIEAFKKHGIAATLEKLKAEVLTAKAVKPAEPVDTQAIQASAIDRYRTCFSLALQAAAKNMIDNHLKAAMFARCLVKLKIRLPSLKKYSTTQTSSWTKLMLRLWNTWLWMTAA